jgi:hypothetical protein
MMRPVSDDAPEHVSERSTGGAAGEAAGQAPAQGAAPRATAPRAGRFARVRWWWFLVAALVIEMWIYGRRGYVEVCVGKQGETDFALVDQPKDDSNRWKFPRCESRMNLGLVSKYDDVTTEAAGIACRGATMLKHQGQGKQCAQQKDGWEHRIATRQAWPWDPELIKHLFWFLQ